MTRPAFTAAVHRRLLLRGLAASAAAFVLPQRSLAQALVDARADRFAPEAVILGAADLHSAYRRLPKVLGALKALRAQFADAPALFVINGDMFERGNAAALRSRGAADWAMLEALARQGPVVLTLGNHEGALEDDLASVVARAEGTGAQVIGSAYDLRRGRLFAPAVARVGLGGRRAALLGLSPHEPFVWRAPHRAVAALPAPVAFAADLAPGAFADADFPILASHAGLAADKAILPTLPWGTTALGGHDHVTLAHSAPGLGYAHAGAWGASVFYAGLKAGETPAVGPIPLDAVEAPADEALGAAVDAVLAEHLTDEDREVVAELPSGLTLPGSILYAAEAVRAAADADIALLSHTTFGQALSAGQTTRWDFDAYIRFDGDIRVAEISGARLARILRGANQHLATDLDARTGDFVLAADLDVDPSRSYRVAVNGWTAINQAAYLGTEDIPFEPVADLRLKAIVEAALRGG